MLSFSGQALLRGAGRGGAGANLGVWLWAVRNDLVVSVCSRLLVCACEEGAGRGVCGIICAEGVQFSLAMVEA